MSFIISRGYAEVQILKTNESNPPRFWNILVCICLNSEKKSKTEKDIYICKTFVCNIGSAILHFCMYKKVWTKNISYSCVTNVRTLHIFFIIRIFNSCELRIENSVTTVTVQHREACRVMPNSYTE